MKTEELENARFETLCVHGSGGADPATGAISPPIYQTSTFGFPDAETAAARFAGEEEGYIYSRLANPNTSAFEREMAFLEGGEAAVAFASGMAAIAMGLLSVAKPGDTIVSARTVYGGTHGLFEGQLKRLGIKVVYVDGRNPANFADAIDDSVKAVYIESPANPTLCIVDIARTAEIAHSRGVPLFVDGTFATPFFQRPLDLGADVVVHSSTKYIGGHGDAMGGVIAGSGDRIEQIRRYGLKEMGAVMSPFTAWLMLRGLKTLAVRMQRHGESALAVARFLESHPRVEWVAYPGLESHPQHATAQKQMTGNSGVIAFGIEGGKEAGEKLLNATKLITVAVSLGDCDTLIEHPASMTHRSYSSEELEAVGIADGLIRLSVGLEHVDDVTADLEQALRI